MTVATTQPYDAAVGSKALVQRVQLVDTSGQAAPGNIQGTLLASAARTTSQFGAGGSVLTNYGHRGIVVFLNVTAASGTGGLSVRIAGIDPISGNAFNLNAAPTAVTATGFLAYGLYPGIAAGFTQTTSSILPRSFRVDVTVGDASSYTYSLGYSLIL